MLRDETSTRCTWFLPRAHPLEAWGDHRWIDGTTSIQQPLIAPLRGGRSEQEVLALIAGIRGWRGHSLVRGTLRDALGGGDFETRWRESLHRGVLSGPAPAPLPAPSPSAASLAEALGTPPAERSEGWEVAFVPSYQVFDGRYANVPWLTEMPDPVTKLVWDNAAYVSPATARELGIEVDIGDLATGQRIELRRDGAEPLTMPVFVVPGHADRVITLPLGWGRRHAGSIGSGIGFDVYPFRTSDALGFARDVSVRRVEGRYPLVVTQEHHSMEGRPIAIDATLAQYRQTPDFAQWRNPTPEVPPLWTQVDYRQPRPPAQGGTSYSLQPSGRRTAPDAPPRYKWGFVVDLSTCTGCSACVVACQAENNIPTVGKRQVELGREMHWMRVDRYYLGGDENHPRIAVQPMACQHCEEAPCENVCPVNATVHSPEGLNDMAYNRCIGTRYCMNNCPYKVRRFNFLDWHGELDSLERMVFNPNVTVRMRGVMEKCTYCVQRLQAARIRARRERRITDTGEIVEPRVRQDEVTPACAQACPSEAIVFGDLNDVESDVHRMAHLDRHYHVLASIGTQPRTTYLGRIWNPNAEMG
jgi:molybdopterin-containing oxidoreductase family iron-sulfur binding subunit